MFELAALFATFFLPWNFLMRVPTPPPLPTVVVQSNPSPTLIKSDPTPTPTSVPTSTPTPTKILVLHFPSPTPTLAQSISTPIKSTPTSTKLVPTPTQSVPTPQATPTAINSGSDQMNYIMQGINDYRRSQGLSPVSTTSSTCSFASVRAQEISSNFNHDGFNNRINSKTLPYPSYSYVTENLAQTSNYKDVANLWINSPGHAANLRANTPYACVENSGNFYAYEGLKP